MNFLISNLLLFTMVSPLVLFNFNSNSDLSSWQVVDDVVMGGRSEGDFYLGDEGHGIFTGTVSLENNGGFSSIRYRFKSIKVSDYSQLVLELKGEPERYQVRVKTLASDRHSYIAYFETTGEWQTVKINLQDMKPTFRGMALNMSRYPGVTLEEIGLLVGNKKAQSFKLEIKEIVLK